METALEMEKEQISMLNYSLKFNRMLYEKGVKDLDQEDSLNSPSELINPPNWILGHVVATRADLLKKLEIGLVYRNNLSRPTKEVQIGSLLTLLTT